MKCKLGTISRFCHIFTC